MQDRSQNTIAKAVVEKLLTRHGAEFCYTRYNIDIWMLEDGDIVLLDSGHSRVDYDYFEEIAIDLLRISPWELDEYL